MISYRSAIEQILADYGKSNLSVEKLEQLLLKAQNDAVINAVPFILATLSAEKAITLDDKLVPKEIAQKLHSTLFPSAS